MSMNWIVFFVSLWVVGNILGATMSGEAPVSASQQSTVDALGRPTSNPTDWISLAWNAFTLDYPFFEQNEVTQIIRWCVMVPLLCAVGYAVAVFLVGVIKGG
jgi:hypothetical protein